MAKRINIAKLVGKGYKQFWNSKQRYVVVKGSRASKKSKTTALWIIYNMMKYPKANALCVRAIYNTLEQSCFTELKWAVAQLGVSDRWSFTKNPLKATYLPTGQVVLFRGLDNPESITSITVEHGYLCWCWWEEFSQIRNEEAFNKVDLSLRGQMDDDYFIRHTITFNPWSDKHWCKKRFFDVEDDDILAMTTNYLVNEFLGEADKKVFDKMRIQSPRRYKVEGLGDWGLSDGLIYENWRVEDFNKNDDRFRRMECIHGLDFGFTNDETAFISSYVDLENMKLYVFDEHYQRGMLNSDIANMIKYKGFSKSEIIADSSEPKSIEELKRLGISRIKPAYKPSGSILTGIQRLQQFEIIVHPTCFNIIVELENYCWDKDKIDGNMMNKPIDSFNHALDSLRYSLQTIDKPKAKAKLLDQRKIRF